MSFDGPYARDPARIKVHRLSDREPLNYIAAGQLSTYTIGSSLPFASISDWTIVDVVWVASLTPPVDAVLHFTVVFLTDMGLFAFMSHDGVTETRCGTYTKALELASDLVRHETASGARVGLEYL